MKTPLLFDLDGTLTDPKSGFLAALNFALDGLGEPHREEAELVQYIGPPLRGTFAILLETEDPERIENAVDLYREHLNERGGKFDAEVYPGMRELIAGLSGQDFQLFVATGKPRSMAEEIVSHFDLARFFDGIYGAELDGRFGDKAELVAHLWDRHELLANHGMMIGDTHFDMRAGRLNGLETIGVTWGYGCREKMTSEAAGRFVDQASELHDAILEIYF